jgi:hypothetical protein
MARENEIDWRANYACSGSLTITKSDSTVLVPICRKLWVGGTGDVALRLLDGSTPVIKAVPTGTMIDGLQFDQVLATNTSATLMVAFY